MPHGVSIDLWHLSVFTPGLALPCALAFLAGVMIERRGWHPPIGWAAIVLIVVLPFAGLFPAAALIIAALMACVVSLWILFGWMGMRAGRSRRHVESLEARVAALEARQNARP